MMSWTYVITAVFICLQAASADEGCIYQECWCSTDSISCENLQLTQIPWMNRTLNKGFTTLILDMNAISVIPVGSLPTNLTDIYLTSNPITTIEDSAFDDSANTLRILSFSSARFTRIPDAFLHLKSLKELIMSDMKVLDWNVKAMEIIGQTVTSLDLQNVGITSWPIWIKFFSQLTQIAVTKGFISSLPEDALDNVINSLQGLDLSNNSLTMVPKALSKLNVLQTLYLHNNKIKDLTWLPQASSLSSLWLNDNQITDANLLSNALRPLSEHLSDLNIQHNLLTAIPDFEYFTRIGGLDFSHNKISDPFSGSAPRNIYVLDFSYNSLSAIPRVLSTLRFLNYVIVPWNSIREIHGTDFPRTTTGVELGFNRISELTDSSFPVYSEIASLHLNNNPIIRISNLAFKNLSQLKELNLGNTKLTRLPLALNYLTSLTMFDISGNTGLICTCLEKSLEAWVLLQSPENVSGKCGQMSIYDFFSKLSPDCPVL